MVFPGVDPRQFAQFKNQTKNIRSEITIDYKENSIFIKFSTEDEKLKVQLPGMIDGLVRAMTEQWSAFLGIRGEMIRKNTEFLPGPTSGG